MNNGMFVKNMSFKVGQTMTVVGVAKPEAGDFAVNIGPGEDRIALHLNPRFNAHGDSNIIVCNSFEGGNWHQEQREQSFPFSPGKEFKIAIKFTPSEFVVTLPDGSTFRFPNRVGAEKYSALNFDGDARIRSIDIK
ncbi:beta-galactoside-binding lectin-like [Simochromis diagramma]|uniref:beta-galactoside-binding lectin-like n=1 Tax=Simochromis diagramma TaxID=43689 RepID=UPI001A7ED6A5|nr:beta-galactoside-binding lectin-like [Simochromis diagramma]